MNRALVTVVAVYLLLSSWVLVWGFKKYVTSEKSSFPLAEFSFPLPASEEATGEVRVPEGHFEIMLNQLGGEKLENSAVEIDQAGIHVVGQRGGSKVSFLARLGVADGRLKIMAEDLKILGIPAPHFLYGPINALLAGFAESVNGRLRVSEVATVENEMIIRGAPK